MTFEPGDLVKIREDCVLEHFQGMFGLVIANMGTDRTEESSGIYYKIYLTNSNKLAATLNRILNHESIFMGKELELISRGEI